MACAPKIKFTVDVRMTPQIVRAFSAFFAAIKRRDDIGARIELRAIEAYAEIQRMGDEARRALGIG